ncbi:hypothetical protein BD769DRAFT_1673070 [Suillus cothurnatus]|nr:hypothetical protein BD769DRAFT_1673070 [Suillus cothurnatus]
MSVSNTDIQDTPIPDPIDQQSPHHTSIMNALRNDITTLLLSSSEENDGRMGEQELQRWTGLVANLHSNANTINPGQIFQEASREEQETGASQADLPAEKNDPAERDTQEEESDGGPSDHEEAQDNNNQDPNAAGMKRAKRGGSTTEVGSHTVEPVDGKKHVPRMNSTTTPRNVDPCERCSNAGRICFGQSGFVCGSCKKLKARCSLVAAKAKPKPKPNAHTTVKAKVNTAASQVPRPVPGPSRGRPYVLIESRKRKRPEQEDDEDEAEDQDTEQEQKDENGLDDAFMAGRVHALPGLIAVLEGIVGELKKEVGHIDRHIRRRRRRL